MKKTGFPSLTVLLFILLIISVVLSLGIGRYRVSPHKVLGILSSFLIPIDSFWSSTDFRVVTLIRMPRAALALLSGASLAMAGAALQGIFKNPLVSPQVIGVTSGSGFGGALAISLLNSQIATMGLAFAFGILSLLLVCGIGRSGKRSSILMLVLAGVIANAFFTALTSLMKYTADPYDKLPAIVIWLMGSFSSATYKQLLIALAPIITGMLFLMLLRFRINILSLGDEDSLAIGINPAKIRGLALTAVAIIASAVVSVAGIIGWVGLVVPHIARMLVGPDHRRMLPASALIGGTYLLWIDNLARAATPAEIPIGIITAIIGAPLFAYLLKKTGGKGWGNG